eukprot:6250581-Prymnesium_polylepis.1
MLAALATLVPSVPAPVTTSHMAPSKLLQAGLQDGNFCPPTGMIYEVLRTSSEFNDAKTECAKMNCAACALNEFKKPGKAAGALRCNAPVPLRSPPSHCEASPKRLADTCRSVRVCHSGSQHADQSRDHAGPRRSK